MIYVELGILCYLILGIVMASNVTDDLRSEYIDKYPEYIEVPYMFYFLIVVAVWPFIALK